MFQQSDKRVHHGVLRLITVAQDRIGDMIHLLLIQPEQRNDIIKVILASCHFFTSLRSELERSDNYNVSGTRFVTKTGRLSGHLCPVF